MSVYRNFYLGPYAEWLVQPSEITDTFSELLEGKLRDNSGLSRPPEIEVHGVLYHRYCFSPSEDRPGAPVREFDSDNMVCGIQDLRGINQQSEINWFASAFEPELRAMTEHLGREPALHWGILGWLT